MISLTAHIEDMASAVLEQKFADLRARSTEIRDTSLTELSALLQRIMRDNVRNDIGYTGATENSIGTEIAGDTATIGAGLAGNAPWYLERILHGFGPREEPYNSIERWAAAKLSGGADAAGAVWQTIKISGTSAHAEKLYPVGDRGYLFHIWTLLCPAGTQAVADARSLFAQRITELVNEVAQ